LQRARFDFQAWLRSSATATLPTDLMLFTSAPERMHQEPTYQVRLVGPMLDPDQDPPIGSAVPALAAYLNEYRTKLDGEFHFIAERGVGQRRLSTLYVNAHRHHGHLGTIWVGGKVVLLSQGTLTL
jgi:trans-2,3-dihydro-3-hydroxyanthranilate isomerase